jgi:RNAse Z (EC 3.1.26.11)
MQITFLGTSSGVPTKSRNVSSVAIKLPQRSEVWLFDCGEGTQHQIMRSEIKSSQITKIFITHLHGDHIFGLAGLLASCGMAGATQRIDIYAPSGLGEYLDASLRYSETKLAYPVKVHRAKTGVVFSDADFTVTCAPLKHRVTAYGYRLTEHDRTGRFDVAKAKSLGIPEGKVYGLLKQGKTVTLEDGRTFDGADFVGPPHKGRAIAYCTDTIYCDNAVELAQNANVLIHEATFAHQDAEMAFARLHSTTTMAAQVALGAQVQQLIMTHFSPRYLNLDELLAEARAIFPNTILAHDFLTIDVPYSTN